LSPALSLGDIVFEEADAPLLVFWRARDDEKVLCVFNMGASSRSRPDCMASGATVLAESGWDGEFLGDVPEYSVWIGRL